MDVFEVQTGAKRGCEARSAVVAGETEITSMQVDRILVRRTVAALRKRFVTKSTRERAEACVRSNVRREVLRSKELATMRTGHFGGSYAIMHFSYVLCHRIRLQFSVATARTSDRRGVNVALVHAQAVCRLQHTLTPIHITHKTTSNHFL